MPMTKKKARELEKLAFTLCAIQNPEDPRQAWAVTAHEFRNDAIKLMSAGWRLGRIPSRKHSKGGGDSR